MIQNGVDFREIIPKVETLPQRFRNKGFFTARVGKIFHYMVPGQIGTDGYDDPPSWEVVINPIGIDKDVDGQVEMIDPGTPALGAILSWLSIESADHEHTDGKKGWKPSSCYKRSILKKPANFFSSASFIYQQMTTLYFFTHFMPLREHPEDTAQSWFGFPRCVNNLLIHSNFHHHVRSV